MRERLERCSQVFPSVGALSRAVWTRPSLPSVCRLCLPLVPAKGPALTMPACRPRARAHARAQNGGGAVGHAATRMKVNGGTNELLYVNFNPDFR